MEILISGNLFDAVLQNEREICVFCDEKERAERKRVLWSKVLHIVG
mgnify:CR=1 FL=1